jgi:molybdenum cofactor cytidylyltransferase
MLEVVILAAGYSSRLGKNKMELLIDDKPILALVIEAFYPLCDKIHVVGGHYYDEISQITKKYPKVNLIKNDNYSLGMFSSVLAGIKEVSNDCFITPGDYPLITSELVEIIGNITGAFVVPTYKGNRGHPVKLSKEVVEDLKNEPIHSNLKVFRDRYEIVHVEVDEQGILLDVDTMESYERVKRIKEGVLINEITKL